MSVNISTSSGYPTNTLGTVRVAAAGAVVDDIFVYQDGSTKWERVVDGPYNIRWAKVVADGTSQTSKVQAALSHARVTTMVIDMDGGGTVTCNGTLNCGGKCLMWMPGTKLSTSTSLVIDNAIIVGYAKEQLFASPNITLTNCKIGTDKFSTCWYTGPASGADQVTQFQKAADTCILNSIKYMYTPAFTTNYVLSKGILLRKDSNADNILEFFSLDWSGDANAFGNTGDTTFSMTNVNDFAIGWQSAKGLRLRNFFLTGPNVYVGGTIRKYIEDPTFNFDNGLRTNSSSPCAGMVGDMGSTSIAGGNRYAAHTAFYSDPSVGGSTDVIIENCKITNFLVGIALNPGGLPQNGDAISINNCWIDYNKVCISTGESQNRSIFVNNLKCWGGTETVFDCFRFGDGTSCPPEVDGLNIAGGVRYLCRLSGFGNSHGLSIKRMHTELLFSLGGNFNDDTGDLFISDSWINLAGNLLADGDGTSTHHPMTIFRGGKLLITGNSYLTYYAASLGPMSFSAKDAVFENVQFDAVPMNTYGTAQTKFKSCKSGAFTFGNDESLICLPPEFIPDQKPLFVTGMTYVTTLGTGDKYASFTRKKIARAAGNNGFRFQDAQFVVLGAFAVSNILDPDNGAGSLPGTAHCEFTMSTSSDEFKMLIVGDTLMTQETDEFGRASILHCFGTVASKNGGTGLVIVRDIQRGVTATSYTFLLYRQQQLIPVFATGNCTSGTTTITSVVIERSATQFPTNISLNSPYFPEGTYIVSYNGAGTLTVSNPANATATGIDILSSDWQGIIYGGAPNPSSTNFLGYKRGDIQINNRFDVFNTVTSWRCIKSGITNSANKPQFVASEWFNDEFTSSTTTSRTVETYFTLNFKVSVASDLTDFKIGTTVGGEEVLAAQPIFSADGWTNIAVNYFDNAATTLYFTWTGTVATSIKIIKSNPVAIT
jgi:hypothetical protein